MWQRITQAADRLFTRLIANLEQKAAEVAAQNARHMKRDEEIVLDSWLDVPIGCCDCGLFHRYDFSVRDGKLVIRARRDELLSAEKRALQPFPFQPRSTRHIEWRPSTLDEINP